MQELKFKRSHRIENPPDITPLIDVVFLLLVFFMLSTTFIVQPGIKVTLPKSSAEKIKKEKDEIEVTIAKDGTLHVEGKEITLDRLKALFEESAAAGKESTAIINADESVAHGRVVEVMDIAKEAGISKLAIATETKREENH